MGVCRRHALRRDGTIRRRVRTRNLLSLYIDRIDYLDRPKSKNANDDVTLCFRDIDTFTASMSSTTGFIFRFDSTKILAIYLNRDINSGIRLCKAK